MEQQQENNKLNSFWTIVKNRRKELGVNQDEMAQQISELLGKEIKQSAYSQIESGKRKLKVDQVTAICKILDIKENPLAQAPAINRNDILDVEDLNEINQAAKEYFRLQAIQIKKSIEVQTRSVENQEEQINLLRKQLEALEKIVGKIE